MGAISRELRSRARPDLNRKTLYYAATSEYPGRRLENMAGTRLYVGNLSFNTTERSLRSAFEQDGRKVVDLKIVTDRETGQPRGFAFVELADEAQADAAINAMNGQALDGRTLKVDKAQERSADGGNTSRGGYGGGGGRGGGYGSGA
jgi:RNA recognition motif-containing protein